MVLIANVITTYRFCSIVVVHNLVTAFLSDCAVCMEGYGRGVSNTCHHCDDTTMHVHIAMGMLFLLVTLLLLPPAVVYLIGGLAAINVARQFVRRYPPVGCRVSSTMQSQNKSGTCTGATSFNTIITSECDRVLDNSCNRCGGEGGTNCGRENTVESLEPDDFRQRYAELDEAVLGAGRGGSGATDKISLPKSEVSGHPRGSHSNAIGSCDGEVHPGTEVGAEVANGGQSTYSGFGDKVKRWVSRLPLDKFKILVVVWQIVTLSSSITGIEFPESYSKFLSWVTVVNLDMGSIFSASCILPSVNFYVGLLVSTLAPLLLVALLVLTYQIAKYRAKIEDSGEVARRAAWSRHMAAGLLLTFMVRFYYDLACCSFKNHLVRIW